MKKTSSVTARGVPLTPHLIMKRRWRKSHEKIMFIDTYCTRSSWIDFGVDLSLIVLKKRLDSLFREGMAIFTCSVRCFLYFSFFSSDSADDHDVKPSMLMLQPSPSFTWIQSALGFVSGFDNMDVNIYNYSGVFTVSSPYLPLASGGWGR